MNVLILVSIPRIPPHDYLASLHTDCLHAARCREMAQVFHPRMHSEREAELYFNRIASDVESFQTAPDDEESND